MVAAQSNAGASMLSSSPAASSPPATTTRPSRLRRLSNLRAALQSSDSTSSRSGRPHFYRSGSTPESRSRTDLAQGTATPPPGPESPGISRTASPFPAFPSIGNEALQSTLAASLDRAQSPIAAQSPPRNRRRSQTTSSLQSVPGLNTEPLAAQAPQSVEMTRAATSEGIESIPAATGSTVANRPNTGTRKDTSPLPSIRFVPFQDTRSTRPSLAFQTVSRTLPKPESTIRVGRYSEKENANHSHAQGNTTDPTAATPDGPSDAPVGFKSKVVSRRHCEFSWHDNSWWVKDVKSSSGTFLNHIRLSQPGQESKPFRVKDGDIVQLGIDFKGGEEAIFRCVKIRILCNRGWQRELNSFNTSAHKQLRKLATAPATTADAPSQSTECTICLSSVAPCQSLFIAPCSHTWHYKCIRPIILTEYPAFLCPNCRAVADLEEDIEEPESWDNESAKNDEVQAEAGPSGTSAMLPTAAGEAEILEDRTHTSPILEEDDDVENGIAQRDDQEQLDPDQTQSSLAHDTANLSLQGTSSQAIPIPGRGSTLSTSSKASTSGLVERLDDIQVGESAAGPSVRMQLPPRALQQILEAEAADNVMTPRNDIGPFAF